MRDDDGGPVRAARGAGPAAAPGRARRRGRAAVRRAGAAAGRWRARGRWRRAAPGRRRAAPGGGRASSSASDRAPASRARPRRAWPRGMPGAARAEGDVVEHGQVGEEQRVLGEQGDAAGVRRHPLRRRVVDTSVRPSSATSPVSGRSSPASTSMRGGLAGAVGAEHRDASRRRPRRGATSTSRERTANRAVSVTGRVLERRVRPMTRAATTTARATARRRPAGRSRAGGRSPAAACGSRPAGCPRR